jgi:DNA-binding CsgD family transcriptional regulator
MRELDVGLILLDASFKPRASNREAVRVLAFPTEPERIQRVDAFLTDKVRASLLARSGRQDSTFVHEFRSGKRRYTCTAFRLGESPDASGAAVLLLLQRPVHRFVDLAQITSEYDLTPRERESVEFLVQGLTTKDIATRMKVSPSTVSAFLRLVMVKMGTNSRAGIVGRTVRPPR